MKLKELELKLRLSFKLDIMKEFKTQRNTMQIEKLVYNLKQVMRKNN